MHTYTDKHTLSCFCTHTGRKMCKAGLEIFYLFGFCFLPKGGNLNTPSENIWHTCMLTCINVNCFQPHTFMYGCTDGEQTPCSSFTQITTAQLQLMMMCLSVRDSVLQSNACLQPKVDSFYVPATCDSLAQHQHNDKSIINTPIIPP